MTALLVAMLACIIWFSSYLTDTISGEYTTNVEAIFISVLFANQPK